MVLPDALTAIVGACTAFVVAVALSSRFPIGIRAPARSRRRHACRLAVLGLGAARARSRRARSRSRYRAVAGCPRRRRRVGVQARRRVDLPRRAPTRAADRFSARGGTGTRNTSGAGAFCARRRDRRRDRCRRLLHVPRRSHRHRTRRRRGRGSSGTTSLLPIRATCPRNVVDHDRTRPRRRRRIARPVGACSLDQRRTDARRSGRGGEGSMALVVLSGHAPRSRDEIAFGPATLHELQLEHRRPGHRRRRARAHRCASSAARSFPATSHTDYDHGAWMTDAGLRAALGPDAGADAITDYVLVRWRAGVPAAAAAHRLARACRPAVGLRVPGHAADGSRRARQAPHASDRARDLLLAARHRDRRARARHDGAAPPARPRDPPVDRLHPPSGPDRHHVAGDAAHDRRLGGRDPARHRRRAPPLAMARRQLPVAYVPPLALAAVLIVIPIAIVLASVLAAPPAHAATRIHPAQALRTE